MEEIRLWKLVQTADGGHSAVAVRSVEKTATEKILEDMLTSSPEVLMEGLSIIGRQNETKGGPLDLLGVDEDGRLVVFELKRSTLTRDAVAQALDYASFLSSLTDEALNQHVTLNSGKHGVARIDDFKAWYQSKFPKLLSSIGKARIVLVGIGADDCTKRIVNFLAQSDVDISIVTFHAFLENGSTFLAKQVEARPAASDTHAIGTKAGNLAELHATLDAMSMKADYEVLAGTIRIALGPSTYQWPYTTGYAFSRPGPSSTGGKTLLNYIAMYVDPAKSGEIRVYLQPRAVDAAGQVYVQESIQKMGGAAVKSPTGSLNFWVKTKKPGLGELLKELARTIADGDPSQMEAVSAAHFEEQAPYSN